MVMGQRRPRKLLLGMPMKSPGRPSIYEQLRIPIAVNTEGAEIGFLRTLVAAHIQRVKSGNMSKKGKSGLLQLLRQLQTIEHLLKE
jgi:hypothetical protein